MKRLQNESGVDRIVRIIAGLVLGALALFATHGKTELVLVIISVILFVTGVIGFCPLYKVVGIQTKK